MNSKSIENGSLVSDRTTVRGRTAPESSVFKLLRRLVGSSNSGPARTPPQPSRSTPSERRRRAEALKSVGLLKQSVKYGGPYRDKEVEDDTRTLTAPGKRWGEDTEDKKDLISFDEADGFSEKDHVFNTIDEERCNPVSAPPPNSPSARVPLCTFSDSSSSESASTVESETSTLALRYPPIRTRRIGSLIEEIDQIKDEESRRLTEVAFLS